MKYPAITLAILLATMVICSASDPRSLIIQKDIDSGILRHSVDSRESGSDRAVMPLGARGAEFQLWGEDDGPNPVWHFLDQEMIGAYQPYAEVTIRSRDPHSVKRTRADIPFSVKVEVWGLSTDPTVQRSARNVSFTREGLNYNPATYSGDISTSYSITSGDLENTSFQVDDLYSSLQVYSDPLDLCGEERFIVRSYPDESVEGVSWLANERIEVWPLAEAQFEGIQSGSVFQGEIPTFRVHYKNSYPKSTTYMQLYKGSPQLGEVGDAIPGATRAHDAAVPQNDTVTLTSDRIEPFIGKDGTYTIEVLTLTPFFGDIPERVAYISFTTDREIEMRGQIFSSE